MTLKREISFTKETWGLKAPFVIARGARIETHVVLVEITENGHVGRGEAVPNIRYGEDVDSVIKQIEGLSAALREGLNRDELALALPAGAARNSLDCALWDLQAKLTETPVNECLGLPYPDEIYTVQTVSIGSVEEMGKSAAKLKNFPMIKVKLDQNYVVERMRAVRKAAPDTRLLIDANESWSLDLLKEVIPALKELGVVMIEQPLPAGSDDVLAGYIFEIPLAADESCHTSADVERLKDLYDMVNIKLDKTGGLTEALKLAEAARAAGLEIMVGCMVGTSLSMAPAMMLATQTYFVDLDAPTLLAEDREYALSVWDGKMTPLDPRLWGGAY